MASREQVLSEAGYRCAVPHCRALSSLDVHPIDEADNLVCLCATCADRYRRDGVPSEQVMTVYKIRLQEMSRALDRDSIDLLFYLTKLEWLAVSGDKVSEVAPLLNAGYLYADYKSAQGQATATPQYRLRLTNKGRQFLDAWQNGEMD